MNWPQYLSPSQVRLAVFTAFQIWSNASGLVFQEVSQGPTDIRLAFFEGEHNDGTGNAFDGPGAGDLTLQPLIFISQLRVSSLLLQ